MTSATNYSSWPHSSYFIQRIRTRLFCSFVGQSPGMQCCQVSHFSSQLWKQLEQFALLPRRAHVVQPMFQRGSEPAAWWWHCSRYTAHRLERYWKCRYWTKRCQTEKQWNTIHLKKAKAISLSVFVSHHACKHLAHVCTRPLVTLHFGHARWRPLWQETTCMLTPMAAYLVDEVAAWESWDGEFESFHGRFLSRPNFFEICAGQRVVIVEWSYQSPQNKTRSCDWKFMCANIASHVRCVQRDMHTRIAYMFAA